jgi:hypothetical protein
MILVAATAVVADLKAVADNKYNCIQIIGTIFGLSYSIMSNLKLGFVAMGLLASIAVKAQGLGGYLNQAEEYLKNNNTQGSNTNAGIPSRQQGNSSGGAKTNFSGLSTSDMSGALRQALTVGAQNASNRLSAQNGFFGNALIKILMPPEARQVENTLREVGMGAQVDHAILTMNRAAEDASSKAAPIFIDAITHMTIQDALGILQGGNTGATQYLKTKTTIALTAAFRPVIQNSLAKVNATRYWNQVFTTYDRLPMATKVNPDLPAYVTERALSGLFVAIAEEEQKIRLNPAAQVTGLLQKVFGRN